MNKNKIIYILVGLLLILGVFGVFYKRFDLTQEKRYTLSDATVKTLESVKKPITIEVYLDGDFPASFKQLQNETKFILEEFRKINPKIDYKFRDPIAEKIPMDTLQAMGMQPSMLPDIKDGKITNIVLYPYAAITYDNYGFSIPLIIQQAGIDSNEQLNKSIENLEYNFASNIKAITEETKKNIGFLVNQDELGRQEFTSFIDMALENYNIGPIIPENKTELSLADVPKLKQMDAIVVAKPRKAFTTNEKIILDQYIMNGGKSLWMLDAVNAEMDTLFRSKNIMAFPVDINLTDMMFSYGVRVNPGLVKDMKQSAIIRLKTGEIAGNPQFTNLMWPYFPLGISQNQNAITKNINPVKFEFPTSIDTLSRKNVKFNVLFESSDRTITKTVPNYVALSEMIKMDSLGIMEQASTPKIFAVSLEGKFQSAYATRSEKNAYPDFKTQSQNNKMIVIADGDVAKNQTVKGQAMPLGFDYLTQQRYGNEQFLRNALDYLLDDSNLMALRNRNLEMRLLDKQRIDAERQNWQWINLLLPLGILGLLGGLFFWLRKKQFS
ncbi:gliding motility-associated ABC transporter substrate-binding protein GldG [Soonwooa purpurea]